MAPLADDRYLEALPMQTARFAEVLRGADLQQRVPTCPEWTMHRLTEHLGQAHRWAAAIVARHTVAPVSPQDLVQARAPDDLEALDRWLRDGADELVDAIRATGPQTPVWSWAEDQRAVFWARRMAHETAVHRADAELARGRDFALEPDLAADAISEWLLMRRTPAGPVWEHGHSKGDVAVRGPVVALLLVLLRRAPPDVADVQVLGDPAVLKHWLEHTRF